MKKIFICLVYVYFILTKLFAGTYDHRNIESLLLNNLNVEVKNISNTKDIDVYINNIKIATYTVNGGNPEIKEILMDKTNSLLAILVGWDSYHYYMKGDFYLLEIFKIDNGIKKLTVLSQDGFEGIEKIQDNPEEIERIEESSFYYKNKENIIKYLDAIYKDCK